MESCCISLVAAPLSIVLLFWKPVYMLRQTIWLNLWFFPNTTAHNSLVKEFIKCSQPFILHLIRKMNPIMARLLTWKELVFTSVFFFFAVTVLTDLVYFITLMMMLLFYNYMHHKPQSEKKCFFAQIFAFPHILTHTKMLKHCSHKQHSLQKNIWGYFTLNGVIYIASYF